MINWKKPIAIAFASAGVFVGSALPQLTLGQTNPLADNEQETIGTFVQDSQPFATPYRSQASSISPSTAPVEEPAELAQQITSLPEANLPVVEETRSSQDFVPNQNDFQSTGLPAHTPSLTPKLAPGLPTVIVRPSADSSLAINDLTVNVEKIAGSNNRDFAVKLTIPESIKIIEVTPVHDPNSTRNFKIHLEQHSTQQQPVDSATSIYSMPIAAPVRSASSLNAVQPRDLPPSPKRMTPVKQQTPIRNGFKKNPFFQSDDTKNKPDQEPVSIPKSASNRTGAPVVFDSKIPPAVPTLNNAPELASFNPVSKEIISPLPFESSADPLFKANSFESNETIHSAVAGPGKMGLGDIGDFMIHVNNRTADPLKNVSVLLEVPPGLDVVVLDRAAEVNKSAGTLTWEIPELTTEEPQFIRYRVTSLAEGTQLQRVWIGHENKVHLTNKLDTMVEVELENPEAPLLPFESN